ncbi:MAG TPA: hypothetical protein VGE60_11340 [Telluria sp.]
MRFAYPCSLFALCALTHGDAQAPGPEPRLCGKVPLTARDSARQAPDPLQRAARELARRLVALDAAVEHGALFYRTAEGSIRVGEISVGDHRSVDLAVATLPGEALVGALHTHARFEYHTSEQWRLSREDIALGRRLLALSRTDPALRLFIVDVGNATLSEYAASGRCRVWRNRP